MEGKYELGRQAFLMEGDPMERHNCEMTWTKETVVGSISLEKDIAPMEGTLTHQIDFGHYHQSGKPH